jgi:hypothetical protein
MGFFSFLKYTFVMFAAQLDTSCGAPFETHCPKDSSNLSARDTPTFYLDWMLFE